MSNRSLAELLAIVLFSYFYFHLRKERVLQVQWWERLTNKNTVNWSINFSLVSLNYSVFTQWHWYVVLVKWHSDSVVNTVEAQQDVSNSLALSTLWRASAFSLGAQVSVKQSKDVQIHVQQNEEWAQWWMATRLECFLLAQCMEG